MKFVKMIKEKIRQFRTGEVRTHGMDIRGRVYRKGVDDTNPGDVQVKPKATATISMRVMRPGQPDEFIEVPANVVNQ